MLGYFATFEKDDWTEIRNMYLDGNYYNDYWDAVGAAEESEFKNLFHWILTINIESLEKAKTLADVRIIEKHYIGPEEDEAEYIGLGEFMNKHQIFPDIN